MFVSLPTDSGKFLFYCLLPAVFNELRKVHYSIIIIVSSLSIKKDLGTRLVRAMTPRNITAVYAGDACEEQTIKDICKGRCQLVFMSPESLLMDMPDMLQSPTYPINLTFHSSIPVYQSATLRYIRNQTCMLGRPGADVKKSGESLIQFFGRLARETRGDSGLPIS